MATTLRRQVLDSKKFTTIPNWMLDDLLRAAGRALIPYEAVHLLLFLARETIGYVNNQNSEIQMSLQEITAATGISHTLLSRWAHALSYIGFMQYLPAKNGEARATVLRLFPHGLPTPEQVSAAIEGMAGASRDMRRYIYTVNDFGNQVRLRTMQGALRFANSEERKAEVKHRFELELKGLL